MAGYLQGDCLAIQLAPPKCRWRGGAITEFSRAQRITQIFMGRSQPPPWWQRFRYTIVQQVVQQARDIGNLGQAVPGSACPRPAPSRFRLHAHGVNPVLAKNRSRMRSEPLVQQNTPHATRSMPKLSSSRVAAAKRNCLLEIFGLEKGVFGEQRGSVRICR